jgi:ornithine decarboxylase
MWNKYLPSVEIFYAVKSGPDPMVLRHLLERGLNFDCASTQEMQLMLSLGCTPDRILFAHPAKDRYQILFAKEKGVKIMTFDCVEEAEKVKELYPEGELILRIDVENTDAPSPMSKKFGAKREFWPSILKRCHELQIRVRGVSFHVGSGGVSA